jgi:2-keto-4-pentenoate hydratase/2-oxohepta-3-ene-1,7-dioic acid hydratase in catechol pathway
MTSDATAFRFVRSSLGIAMTMPSGPDLAIRHIVCIGKNYAEHAREQGAAVPERPVLFTKNPLSASLHEDAIVIPRICQDRPQVDFEGELAVVIGTGPGGKLARSISPEQADDYVIALTCANDVSARWWQKDGAGGQFYRGKAFDTFCPVGPIAIAWKSLAPAHDLREQTRVNGQTMKDASTSQMLFDVRTLVSELSQGHTIVPGTLLLTGTPSGVGFARKPPIFLQEGDIVEIEIAGIGTLRNRVTLER